MATGAMPRLHVRGRDHVQGSAREGRRGPPSTTPESLALHCLDTDSRGLLGVCPSNTCVPITGAGLKFRALGGMLGGPAVPLLG